MVANLVESGTPLGGDVADVHDSFGVIGVDVENGRVDDAGNVRAVWRRARVTGIGGEADLVVGHDVNGTAGRVVGQVRQMERLVDDALARESGVTVQKDRHDLCGSFIKWINSFIS